MARTTTTDILVTKLEISGKAYNVGLKTAGGSLDTFEKKSGKSFGSVKSSALAAAAAVAGVVLIVRKLVALGAEQEKMERRLAFAVGGSTDALLANASALQRQTVFGDEAIISVQTMMVQLGELSGERLTRATRLTLDFASALGIDLKAAGILMAKAATGSTEALSRYGIILDKNIPKNEKFTALLDLMQDKFGGTAAAETDTLFGSIMQTSNAFGDLGEEMGRMNSGVLKTAVKFWGNLAANMADVLAEQRKTVNMTLKQAAALKIQRLEVQLLGEEMIGDHGELQGIILPTQREQLRIMTEITRQRKIMASQTLLAPEVKAITGGDVAAASIGLLEGQLTPAQIQQAETTALLETQQAQIDASREMREVSQEENIAALAANYDMEQQMAISHGEKLIAVKQKEAAHAQMISDLKGKFALQGIKVGLNLFAQGKDLAIGNAIISTYEGAAKALSVGVPPWNIMNAALVVSAGLAQVKQIRSASASGGGGGSTITTPGAAAQPVAAATQDINLSIIGAGDLINKEALAEMFFEGMGDLISASGGRTGNITVDFTEN